MHRIFIVEDDENIRNMVAYALTSVSFEVEGMDCGEKLWHALENRLPSLILLDIMLPGEDGIALLTKIKQSTKLKRIPVIMLTAKGTEYDRVRGLDTGADDYITKPFSVMELISRIRAVLRRWEDEDEPSVEIRVGTVILRSDTRKVFVDGQEVALTYKEFELLHCLMRNACIVMTRDRILEKVWGFDYDGESRTVDMHVKSLRQKLGEKGDIIRTVRNVGYTAEE